MAKKKELNAFLRILKMSGRVLILNIPVALVLLLCLILGKISWLTALLSLLGVWFISGTIVWAVFKDLDNFILYLKQLIQGVEPEQPKLRWGFFSSMRLTKTFLNLKNIWSNQFLSDASVLENLPNPLLMIDPNSKIVFANKAARSFFGKTILNKDITNLLKEGEILSAYYLVLHKKSPWQSIEWENQGPDGKTYNFQVKIESLPASTRAGAVTVISLYDITLFHQLKQQQADFFANASHELKTPLAIISGFIETLQGPAKNDMVAQEKFLKMMAEQTVRMTDLVQNMLQLSKLQITPKPMKPEAVMIPDLLQLILEDFQVRAQKAHKKLTLTLLDDLPRLIGNRKELYHAIQNLVDNAIKYGEKDSTIQLTAQFATILPEAYTKTHQDLPQFIQISVQNTGPVIAADDLQRLFDKFYRVNTNKANPVEGTGLGLGIAQQIVQRHDGFIDVTSSEKEGTTFSIYLPVNL
ncbi:MAG: PAS domain-containing protein [Alphaproteobacteria bacterium]|nr:PAS domain-containing protein [Alphaproteobacteria bacterium]